MAIAEAVVFRIPRMVAPGGLLPTQSSHRSPSIFAARSAGASLEFHRGVGAARRSRRWRRVVSHRQMTRLARASDDVAANTMHRFRVGSRRPRRQPAALAARRTGAQPSRPNADSTRLFEALLLRSRRRACSGQLLSAR